MILSDKEKSMDELPQEDCLLAASANHAEHHHPRMSSASKLPRETLLAQTEVLWEVLATQLRPTEAETDALLASLPSTYSLSSLDSDLQWCQSAPADASVIVLQTLRYLGILSSLQIELRDVAKLILSIRKLYRLPDECAYHNWVHASSVAHYTCVLAYRLELARRLASPLSVFTLIIAALCHDMDHRGTSNEFNVNQRTSIWQAYAYSCTQIASISETSSTGPLLELHHLTLFQGLFKACYPDILAHLSKQEVVQFFNLAEDIILATDIMAHQGIIAHVKKIQRSDLASPESFPLVPILSLFIGACDLSPAARDWLSSLRAAKGIFIERAKAEQMSSIPFATILNVGEDQRHFIESCVRPLFVEIARLFPNAHPSITAIDANIVRWRKLGEHESLQSDSVAIGGILAIIDEAEKEAINMSPQKNLARIRGFSNNNHTNDALLMKRPKQSSL